MTRGVEDLKRRYQSRYPTRAAMASSAFSIWKFMPWARITPTLSPLQLERDKEGGGNVSGVYSLVFRRTAIGWKIVLDHTN